MTTYSYVITFLKEDGLAIPVLTVTTIKWLPIVNIIGLLDPIIGSSLGVDTFEMQVTRTVNDGTKDSLSDTWTLKREVV